MSYKNMLFKDKSDKELRKELMEKNSTKQIQQLVLNSKTPARIRKIALDILLKVFYDNGYDDYINFNRDVEQDNK